MRATRKTSRSTETHKGNCVYTTAELLEKEEFRYHRPEVAITELDSRTLPIRQAGNGSVRMVYEIPKKEGGGAFRPFAFPDGYRKHASFPLDSRGVDPRDYFGSAANQARRNAALVCVDQRKVQSENCPRCDAKTPHTIGATYKACHYCQKVSEV